ncbi:MAG TPA: helicase C-terminal domain-containing protein [Thermomicrobiales bacterium]|nr:helicase C-terminal domain-containing protein [Thermomicrobiales bacterium]
MTHRTSPTTTASEYVALDVEATGADPQRDSVIEVGLVVFTRDREILRYTQTVRPEQRVSRDILRLTGITEEELARSPGFAEIIPTLREHIGSRPIVGQSVRNDIAMLDSAGLKLTNRQVDTFQLATALLPDMPNYGLSAIAERLGRTISDDDRHRALGDAEATAHIFRALLDRIDTYDPSTLSQVAMFARAASWPEARFFEEAARELREAPLFAMPDGQASHTVPLELKFLAPRERPEPLRPTGKTDPVNIRGIEHLLSDDGPLAHVLERYESRPTQVTMAKGVAKALNDEQQLLVEAGTGTGKSLAYLLPSAIYAVTRGERVVVSTATIALQDQLYRKDLPDVHTALIEAGVNEELRVAVMKGRQNYLCLKQWFAHVNDPVEDEHDAALRAKILLWLGQTETGDRAELRLTTEEDRHWRKFASERGRCTPARCPYAASHQCFFHRARHLAANAHVVIANHSLVLSNAAEGRVLPSFERLVIDEAHHLEDEATRQLSFVLDRPALEDAVKALVRTDGSTQGGAVPIAAAVLGRVRDATAIRHTEKAVALADEMTQAAVQVGSLTGELFTRIAALIGKPRFGGGGYAQSQRLTGPVRDSGHFLDASMIWQELDYHLRKLMEAGAWFLQVLDEISLPNDDQLPIVQQRDEAMLDLMSGVDQLSSVIRMLTECFGEADRTKVYWVQRSGQIGAISLNGAPLDVSMLLNQLVYSGLRTVVLTSATLTIDGSFTFIAEHLGLDNAETLDLGSPFDHERSTLVYVPEDMPEPSHPSYTDYLNEVLTELLVATKGRALVLFTSHRALRDARNALKGYLEQHNVIVLGQGVDGNPRQLIERLRSTPGTVVFGTSSFWEGVDVVGDALSVVVIAKFPFSVPSDPVFEARSELYENPFAELSLPLAVLKFKQGFGRLIRSADDRGVCVILDKRAISKRYGSSFVQSLPPCNVVVGSSYELPEEAARWIGAPVAQAT